MKIVLNPIKPALCDGGNDFHVLVRLHEIEPRVANRFKRWDTFLQPQRFEMLATACCKSKHACHRLNPYAIRR